MTPKRGQPPKPVNEHRTEKKTLTYSKAEMGKLEKAWELSGSPNTLSRWLATITLEEAEQILLKKE